jgi:hypothetical protein
VHDPESHIVEGIRIWIEARQFGARLWDARFCRAVGDAPAETVMIFAALNHELYRLSAFQFSRRDAIDAAKTDFLRLLQHNADLRNLCIHDWPRLT